jgi:hypothetical protein
MEKLIDEREIPVVRRKSRKSRLFPYMLMILLALFIGVTVFLFTRSARNDDQYDTVIAVWTMKLRPHGAIEPFNFCRDNSIVGFGWSLQGNPATIREFRAMRLEEGAYPGDTMLGDTLDSFENMTSPGSSYTHLVWTVSPDGIYYICEITGGYRYSRSEAHDRAGMVNFAECIFYRVGSEDLVPHFIIDELGESGVIRFVSDSQAIEVTRKLWLAAKDKAG